MLSNIPPANDPWQAVPVGVVGDVNGNLYVTGDSTTKTLSGGTKQNPTYSYSTYAVTRKGVVNASGIWTWTNIDVYPITDRSGPYIGGVAVDARGSVFSTRETLTPDAGGNYTVEHAAIRSNEDGYWHTVDDYQLAPGQNASYGGLVSDGSGTVYAFGKAVDLTGGHWIVRSPIPAVAPAKFSASMISSANVDAASTGFFSPTQPPSVTDVHHGHSRPIRLKMRS